MTIVNELKYTSYHPQQETLRIIIESRKFAKTEKPVTIRQIFYHLVAKGIIENTQKEYAKLDRILVKARKAGFIPFEWIEDRSRNPLIVPLHRSILEYMKEKIEHYYKDTWENQPNFIIILLEKEALAGIVWSVASYFNVPVFPTKGYSSWSMFYDDLRKLVMKYSDKNLVILVLGDYDPSGTDIPRDHIEKLKFLGINPTIVERVALTKEQVVEYQLPPQMAKKIDPRYEKFSQEYGEHSVELDALKPSILREMVHKAILKYLDLEKLSSDLEIEKKEKDLLKEVLNLVQDSIGEDG